MINCQAETYAMKRTQARLGIARETVVAKEHTRKSFGRSENTDAHMTGELRDYWRDGYYIEELNERQLDVIT